MALKDATADAYYYRANFTTFLLDNLSQDNPDHEFAISDYFNVLSTIFTTDIDPTTNEPYRNFTTTELLFYAYRAGLGGVVDPTEVLASWLATPFVMFQANSYMDWWQTSTNGGEITNLPQELYTTVDLAQSVSRGVISTWTVFIFLILACVVYFTCFACICWSMTVQGPRTTHFQLVEFAARVVSKGQSSTSWATVLSKTANGDKEYLRNKLVDKNVYLGDVRSLIIGEYDDDGPLLATTGTIGFSLTGDVVPLKSGKLYG
jgi:hypothetical protein